MFWASSASKLKCRGIKLEAPTLFPQLRKLSFKKCDERPNFKSMHVCVYTHTQGPWGSRHVTDLFLMIPKRLTHC